MNKTSAYPIEQLKTNLALHGIKITQADQRLTFNHEDKQVTFFLVGEGDDYGPHPFIAVDYLVTAPEKIAAMVLSKLKLNRRVFARNCEVKKTDKNTAEQFTDLYHLIGATQSAYNMGLYLNDELLALASFSKGRKMNRLAEHERSYELIRFCSKSGLSVSGGLSKLLKKFSIEKNAGDIMTYVDKQWGEGAAFLKLGFKKHSETEPHYFLINRKTFERIPLKDQLEVVDQRHFYRAQNLGNIKLVYTPAKEK